MAILFLIAGAGAIAYNYFGWSAVALLVATSLASSFFGFVMGVHSRKAPNQTINFHMPQGGYDKRTQEHIAKATGEVIQKAMRRIG